MLDDVKEETMVSSKMVPTTNPIRINMLFVLCNIFFFLTCTKPGMEQQLRDQFQRAFDALLEEKIANKEFEWVVRLYVEIRDRLCAFVPRRTDLHTDLKEHMDEVIFQQMLENDAYQSTDLVQLINYLFNWMHRLQAPIRDTSTEAKKQALFVLLAKETTTFGNFVPVFIKTIHALIEEIQSDIQVVKDRMSRDKS